MRHPSHTAIAGLAAFIAALTLLFAPRPVEAAHPLRLADFSTQSRVELEIAYGKMKAPLPADYTHYLLRVEANLHQGVHLKIGLPFSGYSGVDGSDNFIRGNVLLGASYHLPLLEWLSMGFELRLYLPTYERAQSVDYGMLQDPRRAVLTHWHYRFQYALEDSFPINTNVAARFEVAGFYTQLEGGFTWAPNIRQRSETVRKDNVWILHYGLALGYDLFGYVELGAAITGLFDPQSDTSNMAHILGQPYLSPRSMTVVSIGPRVQYKWAVFRFEANFPLESDFRDMLSPYYLFALQAQF